MKTRSNIINRLANKSEKIARWIYLQKKRNKRFIWKCLSNDDNNKNNNKNDNIIDNKSDSNYIINGNDNNNNEIVNINPKWEETNPEDNQILITTTFKNKLSSNESVGLISVETSKEEIICDKEGENTCTYDISKLNGGFYKYFFKDSQNTNIIDKVYQKRITYKPFNNIYVNLNTDCTIEITSLKANKYNIEIIRVFNENEDRVFINTILYEYDEENNKHKFKFNSGSDIDMYYLSFVDTYNDVKYNSLDYGKYIVVSPYYYTETPEFSTFTNNIYGKSKIALTGGLEGSYKFGIENMITKVKTVLLDSSEITEIEIDWSIYNASSYRFYLEVNEKVIYYDKIYKIGIHITELTAMPVNFDANNKEYHITANLSNSDIGYSHLTDIRLIDNNGNGIMIDVSEINETNKTIETKIFSDSANSFTLYLTDSSSETSHMTTCNVPQQAEDN